MKGIVLNSKVSLLLLLFPILLSEQGCQNKSQQSPQSSHFAVVDSLYLPQANYVQGFLIYQDKYLVLDISSNKVFVYNQSGQLLETLGGDGIGPGEMRSPWAFEIFRDKWLLVSDLTGARIQVFNLETYEFEYSYTIADGSSATDIISAHEKILVHQNRDSVFSLVDTSGVILKRLIEIAPPFKASEKNDGWLDHLYPRIAADYCNDTDTIIFGYNFFPEIYYVKVDSEFNIHSLTSESVHTEYHRTYIDELYVSNTPDDYKKFMNKKLWLTNLYAYNGQPYLIYKYFRYYPDEGDLYLLSIPHRNSTIELRNKIVFIDEDEKLYILRYLPKGSMIYIAKLDYDDNEAISHRIY